MTTLATLPSPILAILLRDFKAFKRVYRLWSCAGDVLLNRSLSAGGVASLLLESPFRLSRTNFPSIVFQLKLQKLVLSSSRFEPLMTHQFSQALQQLQSSLTWLELRLPCARQCLIDFELASARFLRDPSEIDYSKPEDRIWNVGNVFPHLETLILIDLRETREKLSNADISLLPPSLTHLTINIAFPHPRFYQIIDGDFNAALLPRSLLYLDFLIGLEWTTQILDDLPPTLTHLGSLCLPSGDKEIFDAWVGHLPKSLTSWSCVGQIEVDQVSSHFPPSLTDLTVISRSDSVVSNPLMFPMPYLTRLDWTLENADETSIGLNYAQLAHLPATITSLTIPGIVSDRSAKPSWPQFLTELSIGESSSLNPSLCMSLPRSLVTLKLGSTVSSQYFQLPLVVYLPRSLEDLEIARSCHFLSENGDLITDEHLEQRSDQFLLHHRDDPLLPFVFEDHALPPNLRRLRLEDRPQMNCDCLTSLPPSITDLYVNLQGQFQPTHARSLPPNMQSFNPGNAQLHMYSIPLYPRSLTALSLGNAIPDSGSALWKSDILLFEKLPPTLTKLVILALPKSAWQGITPLCFPTSLVHMRLGSWKRQLWLEKSIVATLPPQLTRLSVAIMDLATAPIDLMARPQTQGLPDSELFDLLPRNLRSLKLRYPYSTILTLGKEYMDHLPPRLTDLDVTAGGMKVKNCGLLTAFNNPPPK